MPHAYPQWKGFERAPEGHLLDQVIDLSGPMGIAYERSIGFHKDFHAHDRPMIVLPRGSCKVTVRTRGEGTETHTIGSAVALLVPSRVQHEDEAVSAIFDALALYPTLPLITAVADDEGIPAATVAKLLSRPRELPRSRWLEQLAQEYVLARIVSRRESAKTLAFFERQLLVEILASLLRRRKAVDPPAPPSGDTVTGRAVRYVEANLFSDLPLSTIARHASRARRPCYATSAATPGRVRTPTSRRADWKRRAGCSKREPTPWATSRCSWATRASRPSPRPSRDTSAHRPPPSGYGLARLTRHEAARPRACSFRWRPHARARRSIAQVTVRQRESALARPVLI